MSSENTEANLNGQDENPFKLGLAIGKGAYEAGNLAGGVFGAAAIVGDGAPDRRWFVMLLACIVVIITVGLGVRAIARAAGWME